MLTLRGAKCPLIGTRPYDKDYQKVAARKPLRKNAMLTIIQYLQTTQNLNQVAKKSKRALLESTASLPSIQTRVSVKSQKLAI